MKSWIVILLASVCISVAASEPPEDPVDKSCRNRIKLVVGGEPDMPLHEQPGMPGRRSSLKRTLSPKFSLKKAERSFFNAEDAVFEKHLSGDPYVAREWKAVFYSPDRMALDALEIIHTSPYGNDSVLAAPHVLRYLQMKMSVWNSLRENGSNPTFLLRLGRKGEPDLVDRMIHLYQLRMKHILAGKWAPNELRDVLPTSISLAASSIPLDWVLAKDAVGAPFSDFARTQVAEKLIPLANEFLFSFLPDTLERDPRNTLLVRFSVMS